MVTARQMNKWPSVMPLPDHLKTALKRLRKRVPLEYRVVVRVVDIPIEEDCIAICDYIDDRFLICLDRALVLMVNHIYPHETLAHEYAHAVVWDVPEQADHPDFWGVAYARCYRAVFSVT